ncbi:hypothetical protein [Streptomyces albogriseolus]|uniref:hypothetical protein n=1 Tax=Streptomyces TaxID=1883 RepID=UPI0016766DEB|nr:hypothetical protein [Streptomyces viridodiastaticus]
MKTAKWRFSSRKTGYERVVPLELHPEINLSPMVDEYYDESGEEQFRQWVKVVRRECPKQWEEDAVSIYWGVSSPGNGVFETAPFQRQFMDRVPPVQDFLAYFTWPVHETTGEKLDWFKLPVVNERFKAWAEALDWTPSPLQATCPLRSIVESRGGIH